MSNQPRGPLAGPLAASSKAGKPPSEAESRDLSDANHPPTRDDTSPQPTVRVSRPRLLQLAEQLPQRELAIIDTVGTFRLLRADQIRRLHFHDIKTDAGRARICRRTLQRLSSEGLLHQLDKRPIGGRRGGSKSHVYTLAPAGRRLLDLNNGAGLASDRGVHEPGLQFQHHTLAIADLYLTLVEAERAGQLELLAFDVEPLRTYTSPVGRQMAVKPDALTRLAVGEYEYVAFCELDCATEGRGALQRRINAYLHLYRSGREQAEHGLFPRVVWITPNPARATHIRSLTNQLPPATRRLFTTTTIDRALKTLTDSDTPEEQAQ